MLPGNEVYAAELVVIAGVSIKKPGKTIFARLNVKDNTCYRNFC